MPRIVDTQRLIARAALVLIPIIWPVGIAVVWASALWTSRQKLLATVLFPGGYFTSVLIAQQHIGLQGACGGPTGGAAVCSSTSPGFAVLVILIWALVFVGPLLAPIYLSRRMG